MRRYAIITPLILTLAAAGFTAETVDRARMHSIFGSLTTLLHLDSTGEFAEPKQRDNIQTALDLMAANAKELSRHAAYSDSRGFTLIASSLAADSETALQQLERNDIEGSRILVRKMADACFACHSRLPSGDGPGLGAALMLRPETQALPPHEQLRLAVATRELELAMDLGEAILRSDVPPLEIESSGAIDDYLRVAIRMRGDFKRPSEALKAWRNRADMPAELKETVEVWLRSMEHLDPAPYTTPKLETAKALIAGGRALSISTHERNGLIHYIQASGLLHQFVDSNPQPESAEAEAYYLLGMLDMELSRNTWAAEAQFYLEAAIQSHPLSDTAKNAYYLLEESVSQSYAGCDQADVPPAAVREKLDWLQRLAF